MVLTKKRPEKKEDVSSLCVSSANVLRVVGGTDEVWVMLKSEGQAGER